MPLVKRALYPQATTAGFYEFTYQPLNSIAILPLAHLPKCTKALMAQTGIKVSMQNKAISFFPGLDQHFARLFLGIFYGYNLFLLFRIIFLDALKTEILSILPNWPVCYLNLHLVNVLCFASKDFTYPSNKLLHLNNIYSTPTTLCNNFLLLILVSN